MDKEKMTEMFSTIAGAQVWANNKFSSLDDKFLWFNLWYFPQSSDDDAGETYVDQMFRIFDKDGDGSIDFKVTAKIPQVWSRTFFFFRNSW